MTEYVARAVVELEASDQWGRSDGPPAVWPQFPFEMGPFRLDVSPNAGFYFDNIFGIDPHQMAQQKVDGEYPVSAIYLDTHLEVPDGQSPVASADKRLNDFELLMRLFQPGSVSVRRHLWIRNAHGGGYWIEPWGSNVKSPVATQYVRPSYPLNDATLGGFSEFFAMYWDLLDGLKPSIKLGLSRFNSSYERRELVDRLIDLVIVLESVFNDGDTGSVTFKIATRCAGWLHPAGDGRLSAFRFMKEVYGFRSNAVHARSSQPKAPTTDDVDRLERVVRAGLMKFLNHGKLHGSTPAPRELDEMMMAGRFL